MMDRDISVFKNKGSVSASVLVAVKGLLAKRQNLGGGKFCLFAGSVSDKGARQSGRSSL